MHDIELNTQITIKYQEYSSILQIIF